jgi:hypothetical protein
VIYDDRSDEIVDVLDALSDTRVTRETDAWLSDTRGTPPCSSGEWTDWCPTPSRSHGRTAWQHESAADIAPRWSTDCTTARSS